MKVVDSNFISQYMTKKHTMRAFGLKKSAEIDDLIAGGWIVKYYQYFRPTFKLFASLCPDEIEIKDFSRINGLNRFGFKDIQKIFDCDYGVAKTIADKYFVKSEFGYYKRSDELNQLLADGETILRLRQSS